MAAKCVWSFALISHQDVKNSRPRSLNAANERHCLCSFKWIFLLSKSIVFLTWRFYLMKRRAEVVLWCRLLRHVVSVQVAGLLSALSEGLSGNPKMALHCQMSKVHTGSNLSESRLTYKENEHVFVAFLWKGQTLPDSDAIMSFSFWFSLQRSFIFDYSLLAPLIECCQAGTINFPNVGYFENNLCDTLYLWLLFCF